ncbi:MAG: hypothetical protein HYZ28_01285 [Myxococcales bacterium]|nr:hypothetical protein [Myxococcales bacterium]
MRRLALFALAGALSLSCSSSPPRQPVPDAALMGGQDGGVQALPDASVQPDASAEPDASVPPPDSGSPDAGPPDAGPTFDECDGGVPSCLAFDQRRYCGSTAQGTRWLNERCAQGSGCVRGACVVGGCSDECNLGDSAGGKTCRLFDVSTGQLATLDPAGSLSDRSRSYQQWLKRDGLASGGVGSARYSDPPVYSTLEAMDGIGDSAIWTGTYLAAEALRFQATGAPDARANALELIDTLHLWFNVSGSPGYLARFAIKSGTPVPFQIGDLDCTVERVHCGVQHQGISYDYIGHVSRDQYQGVLLGYALAYEALSADDEAARKLIREDVVELVKELMAERTVPLRITLNGLPLSPTNVKARFIVVNSAEMKNGALDLRVNLSKPDDSEMYGFQEFSPDLADLIREIPGLGWVPNVPRPSSAVMLASFFRVALRVTENVPAHQADRAAILAYYTSHSGKGGNATDWLTVAKQWSSSTSGCGGTYYSNNITMQPLYNLARLEDDPTRKAEAIGILTGKMWPVFSTTKNPFFSFIYAGVAPSPDPLAAPSALAQLSQFLAPPRVHVPVDLRQDPRYLPHDSSCADHVDHSTAVDVGDRIPSDFIWQRQPWGLYDPGNVAQTYPGVDYLVAYWLGRHHGFIADDKPSQCLVMR